MNRYHLYVRQDRNGDAVLMERVDPKGEWVRARDINDLPPCPVCGVGTIGVVNNGVSGPTVACANCNTLFQPVPQPAPSQRSL